MLDRPMLLGRPGMAPVMARLRCELVAAIVESGPKAAPLPAGPRRRDPARA
jgi:hypothetical protein